MTRARLAIAVGLALHGVLLLPSGALAIGDDRIELFIERKLTSDDNVFRLSPELDPESVIGRSDPGDTLHTTSVGALLDLPISRQRLRGELAIDRVRFDEFSELDLDGHRASLAWEWLVGSRWSGVLGYQETEALASFANIQGGVQASEPNVLTTGEASASVEYKLTERWRIAAEAGRGEHDNSADESRISDATITRRGLTVRYLTPAGSEIAVSAENSDASLPVRQALAGGTVDNSYRQRDVSVGLEWALTPETRLGAGAGRVEREHSDLPERDFSGTVHHVGWNWQATDTLDVAVLKERVISPYEQVNVGFVLLDSITARAYWRITEKLSLTISRIDGNRRYLGNPGLALPAAEPRVEDVRMTQFGLDFMATDYLSLALEWRDDSRATPVAFGDYDARILSIGVQGHF